MPTLDTTSLTALDWFLVLLTTVSVITAFRQGLVKVVFSLSGLIFGVLSATWIHNRVANSLQTVGGVDASAQILAFLAVVVVVYIGFAVAGAFARKAAMGAGSGLVDRFLGAGFGLLRGGLTGAVVLVTLMAAMPRSTIVERSQFAPYVLQGTRSVAFMVPDSFREGIDTKAAPQPGLVPASTDALVARSLKPRQSVRSASR
jgi:membrane protein required for colicin V production